MARLPRLVIAFVSLTLILAACGGQTASPGGSGAPADEAQTTLTIGVSQEPQTFDPNVNVAAVSAYRYYGNIYEGLLRYAPDGTIEPLLAKDWSVSDDGLTYTFELRDDVKYSDGTQFNAEGVKASIERLRAIGVGGVAFFAPIETVEVVDDYTVKFHLNAPYAPLPAILAGWQGAIFASPTAATANAEGDDLGQAYLNNHTAGTGPFMLQSWEPSSRIVLVRNPYYRDEPAADDIQTILYSYVAEPATLRQQLAQGDLDIAEQLTPAIIGPLQEEASVSVNVNTSYAAFGTHVYFNLTEDPFKDVHLRRAIAFALDYDRLAEVWQGTAEPAHGFLPKNFAPYFSADEAFQYHQDLDQAKAELEAAGYDDPIDPPLQLELIWQAGQTAQRDMAQLMQEDLAKIGIQLDVQEREITAWREAIWSKDFDLAFFGLPLRYADPDSIASLSFISTEIRDKGFNPGIDDEQIDQLTLDGRATQDPEERVAIYNEMQKVITENAYFLPLVETKFAWAARKNVTGVEWNSYYGQYWDGTKIKKTGSGS